METRGLTPMTAFAADQAEGLRALFARDALQVLPVVSGAHGCGKTTVVTHLATAAATLGRKVAVLDASRGDVAEAFGLTARYELKHLLENEKAWNDVALRAGDGIRVVPAARGFASMTRTPDARAHLFPAFADVPDAPDLLIVNLPAGESAAASILDPDGDLLLVLTPRETSLTAAYGVVKRFALAAGHRRVRVLVNRVASPAEAKRVHATFAEASRRFLAFEPTYAGFVANEPEVGLARRARRTVFATAPLCSAGASFQRLAETLDTWNLARYGERAA